MPQTCLSLETWTFCPREVMLKWSPMDMWHVTMTCCWWKGLRNDRWDISTANVSAALSSTEAPAGYPHQNINYRKNRKRALFFFSPASPQHKEASAEERVSAGCLIVCRRLLRTPLHSFRGLAAPWLSQPPRVGRLLQNILKPPVVSFAAA